MKIWRLIQIGEGRIFSLVGVGIILASLDISGLYYLTKFLKSATEIKNTEIANRITFFALMVLVIYGIRLVLGVLGNYYINYQCGKMEINIKNKFLIKYQALNFIKEDRRSISELANVLNSWIPLFGKSIVIPLFKLINEMIISVAIIIFLLWSFTSITLYFMAIVITVGFIYAKIVKKRINKEAKIYKEVGTKIAIDISNALDSRMEFLNSKFSGILPKIIEENSISIVKSHATANTLSQSSRLIVEALVIIVGVFAFYSFMQTSNADNLDLSKYSVLIYGFLKISSIASLYGATTSNINIYREIIDYLYQDGIISGEENLSYEDNYFYRIQIDDLIFTHTIDEKKQGLTFDVYRGEKIAILGNSGSGKSTLLKIILGLSGYFQGKCYVFDKNERRYIHPLIYKSAYLTQKPFIFSGTIRDNIAMKKTEVNDKLIINILNEITAENFSKDLDKYLENNGENISSGQRQKIVLARALYNRADLIFIDEATNAIDSKSEEIIYKYLLGMDGVTIVSVSHRENINNLFQKKILLD